MLTWEKYLKLTASVVGFLFWVVAMREIELCMLYADNCTRCPLNMKCEEEYQKEMEQRSGGVSAKDLQVLWGSKRRSHLPIQKEPGKTRGQTK